MSEFKVRDTVRLVDNKGLAASVGATAKVTGHEGRWLKVRWLENSNGQFDGRYYPSSFELLKAATPTPGTVVDVTRKTVTKTVEEEVVEYPEFPHGTVVEDASHWVLQWDAGHWHGVGNELWHDSSDLTWPVTVLRYGQ